MSQLIHISPWLFATAYKDCFRKNERGHSDDDSGGLSPAMREKLDLQPLSQADIDFLNNDGEKETLYDKVKLP